MDHTNGNSVTKKKQKKMPQCEEKNCGPSFFLGNHFWVRSKKLLGKHPNTGGNWSETKGGTAFETQHWGKKC